MAKRFIISKVLARISKIIPATVLILKMKIRFGHLTYYLWISKPLWDINFGDQRACCTSRIPECYRIIIKICQFFWLEALLSLIHWEEKFYFEQVATCLNYQNAWTFWTDQTTWMNCFRPLKTCQFFGLNCYHLFFYYRENPAVSKSSHVKTVWKKCNIKIRQFFCYGTVFYLSSFFRW